MQPTKQPYFPIPYILLNPDGKPRQNVYIFLSSGREGNLVVSPVRREKKELSFSGKPFEGKKTDQILLLYK